MEKKSENGMKYNKLVRDKIPEIIRQEGRTPVTHVADEVEYWQTLKEKLNEEIAEFQKDENIEELADVLEVIEAIMEFKKVDRTTVESVKAKKAEERGRFKDRIILEES